MGPKIGLLLFTAQWFADIGATGGSFATLPELLDADAAAITQALTDEGVDVAYSGVLATREQVRKALAHLRHTEVDAVVICQITWGEDWLLLATLDALPELGRELPLMVWCYVPARSLPDPMSMVNLFRFSGPVGTLQASGPLHRRGVRFSFVYGTHRDSETVYQIAAFARAAAVRRSLRGARVGILPYRCDQMSGTWVDEVRLRDEIGPEVSYISLNDYRAHYEAIPEARVTRAVQTLRATYPVADSVTEAGMYAATRASLGLAEVARHYDLDAIAVEDVSAELHQVVGLRPCLAIPIASDPAESALFERAVVSMEADVGAAVALIILRRLTGGTPMYTEVFTADNTDNTLLMGHAGIHDAPHLVTELSNVLIEPDGEYVESEPDSAWMRFRVKGGSVTLSILTRLTTRDTEITEFSFLPLK